MGSRQPHLHSVKALIRHDFDRFPVRISPVQFGLRNPVGKVAVAFVIGGFQGIAQDVLPRAFFQGIERLQVGGLKRRGFELSGVNRLGVRIPS